jgi:hypothetical protein
MDTHENEDQSPRSKVNSYALEVQSLEEPKPVKRKCTLTRFQKVLIIVIPILLVIGLGIFLPIWIRKKDNKVDSYEETQYNLIIKTEITTTVNNSTTTTHDDFRATFFALDMQGEKYRLLVSKGSFESNQEHQSLGSVPSDIFIYLEASSKDGKILLSKYKNTTLDEYTINLLTGITQYFVVDQESSWDYSSDCKGNFKKGQGCSYNSKQSDGDSTVYYKYEKSDDQDIADDIEYEHHARTKLNKEGKVDKVELKGNFKNTFDYGEKSSKIEFHVKAHVEVLSSDDLTKDQIKELNQIADQLPQADQKKTYSKASFNDFEEEIGDNIEDENLPESLKLSNPKRELSQNNNDMRRSLFYSTKNYEFLKYFDESFYLDTSLIKYKDDDYRYWLCAEHRYLFGPLELKLLKNIVCFSSHYSKNYEKSKVKSLSYKGDAKKYIDTVTFSIFTIKLTAKVKVDNTPYFQVYYNTYKNTVANLSTKSKISISITGVLPM